LFIHQFEAGLQTAKLMQQHQSQIKNLKSKIRNPLLVAERF